MMPSLAKFFARILALAIAGKIVDDVGEPVLAGVYAIPKTKWNAAATRLFGSTNEIGEFRISGLHPGRFMVVAIVTSQRQNRSGTVRSAGVSRRVQPAANGPADEDYAQTFFPSATDESAAAVIELDLRALFALGR